MGWGVDVDEGALGVLFGVGLDKCFESISLYIF
jgi:hypothetical protein